MWIQGPTLTVSGQNLLTKHKRKDLVDRLWLSSK